MVDKAEASNLTKVHNSLVGAHEKIINHRKKWDKTCLNLTNQRTVIKDKIIKRTQTQDCRQKTLDTTKRNQRNSN